MHAPRTSRRLLLALLLPCAAACGDGRERITCDAPGLLADRCSGGGCHEADQPAAGLDLISAGLDRRIALVEAAACAGLLADPSDPEGSVMYEKVAGTHACGEIMPPSGARFTEKELLCVRDWISGLPPPCLDCVCVPGEMQACYSGPPGTENQGRCHGGAASCGFDGKGWGPCVGEVAPVREDCRTSADEDCDGELPLCGDTWSVGFGGLGAQNGRSVVVDGAGHVYLAGDFEGTVSFGGEALTASGLKSDVVLAKYDESGNYLWAKRFGDTSNQFSTQLAIDAAGNLFLIGRAFGTIDFGGETHDGRGSDDVFVVSFDSDGEYRWSRIFGGLEADRAERVAVDPSGDVLVTGTFGGRVDFGAGEVTSAGQRDIFVLKLDGGSGAVVWSKQVGGSGDDYGFGVDADAAGNVFLTGRFENGISFGSPLSSHGGYDVYLVKLTEGGGHVWSRAFGGGGDDVAFDLAVERSSGDVIVTGTFEGEVDFGGGQVASAGSRDLFLARYSGAGVLEWADGYGDGADQFATAFGETNTWTGLDIDGSGAIWLAGPLAGAAGFGGGTLQSAGQTDVFVVQLSPSGGFLAGTRFGTSAGEMALDVVAASAGTVVITGRMFGGRLDFGAAGEVVGGDSADGFAAKIRL